MSQHDQAHPSPTSATTHAASWEESAAGVLSLWSQLFSPRLWFWCFGFTLLWFTGTHTLFWWTQGQLAAHSHTWITWVDRFLLGVLSLLMLARLLEQYFLLTGHPTLPLPLYDNSRQYRLPTPTSYTGEDLIQILKKHGVIATRRGEFVLWIEQGTLHAWGRWFVMLALFLMTVGLLIAPHWPALHLATRVSLLSSPWLLVGIVLQWSSPHRVLAVWPSQQSIEMWGHSESGWLELSRDVTALQSHILATVTSQTTTKSTSTIP